MFEIELPQYRGRTASREWVYGLLTQANGDYWITLEYMSGDNIWLHQSSLVDISTIAIHLPGVEDPKGSKVYAAINESGIGGSQLKDRQSPVILKKGVATLEGKRLSAIPNVVGITEVAV